MKTSRKQRKELTAKLFEVCREQLRITDCCHTYYKPCTKAFKTCFWKHFYKVFKDCKKGLGTKRTNQILQQVLDESQIKG